jgi:hypothetical protein
MGAGEGGGERLTPRLAGTEAATAPQRWTEGSPSFRLRLAV